MSSNTKIERPLRAALFSFLKLERTKACERLNVSAQDLTVELLCYVEGITRWRSRNSDR